LTEVIDTMEGPIAMTECISDGPGCCDFESSCRMKAPWQIINQRVRLALADISLIDIAQPRPESGPVRPGLSVGQVSR